MPKVKLSITSRLRVHVNKCGVDVFTTDATVKFVTIKLRLQKVNYSATYFGGGGNVSTR